MESNQKAGTTALDRARLLGFDQTSNQPVPGTTLMAKVGEKTFAVMADKVGSKPLDATKDAGLANLTKVGFKENLRR